MVKLLTVTTPVALIDTDMEIGLELIVPSSKVRVVGTAMPLPLIPTVATIRLHGLMVSVLPCAKGEVAAKLDLATVKMHEPKFMVPDAEPSAELMSNEGAAPLPDSFRDVADVVPKPGTPELNSKLLSSTLFTNAVPVCGVISAERLLLAIGGGDPLSPLLPPQADSKALPLKIRQARETLLKIIKILKKYHYWYEYTHPQIDRAGLPFS